MWWLALPKLLEGNCPVIKPMDSTKYKLPNRLTHITIYAEVVDSIKLLVL